MTIGDERRGLSRGAHAFRTFVIVSSAGLGGCSFVLVPIPPSAPAERTPEAAAACTTSHTVPTVDAVLTGVGLLYTVSGITSDGERAFLSPFAPGGTTAVGATTAVLAGAATVYGFLSVARCNELREEIAARDAQWPKPLPSGSAPVAPAPPPSGSAAPPAATQPAPSEPVPTEPSPGVLPPVPPANATVPPAPAPTDAGPSKSFPVD